MAGMHRRSTGTRNYYGWRSFNKLASCATTTAVAEDADLVVSQEALAKALGTTSNTISRWETAVYKPSVEDLDRALAVPLDLHVGSWRARSL
jgi:hypothetical protein